jgi:hypothetical protein
MEPPLAGPYPVAFLLEQIRKLRVKAEAAFGSGTAAPRTPGKLELTGPRDANHHFCRHHRRHDQQSGPAQQQCFLERQHRKLNRRRCPGSGRQRGAERLISYPRADNRSPGAPAYLDGQSRARPLALVLESPRDDSGFVLCPRATKVAPNALQTTPASP